MGTGSHKQALGRTRSCNVSGSMHQKLLTRAEWNADHEPHYFAVYDHQVWTVFLTDVVLLVLIEHLSTLRWVAVALEVLF